MAEATEESTGTEEHEHWRTYTYVRGRAKLTDGCCLASEVCVCVCVWVRLSAVVKSLTEKTATEHCSLRKAVPGYNP